MRFWPFKLRKHKKNKANVKVDKSTLQQQQQHGNSADTTPLADSSRVLPGSSAVRVVAQAAHSSTATRKQREGPQKHDIDMDQDAVANSRPRTATSDKENRVLTQRKASVEDITALPVSWQLNQSPHLRPADSERADVSYSARPDAFSSTSVNRAAERDGASSSKPGTLRSKRSTFDSKSVKRRSSTKRKDDHLRQEEIRAMSAVPPVPKRPAENLVRKDSYKRRTFSSVTSGTNDDRLGSVKENEKSNISLSPRTERPTEMGNLIEQHGWEVQHFWVNPRPAVRLSSIPAYSLDSAQQPDIPLPRDLSKKLKAKESARDFSRRHRTVGADADDLDSNDLRAVLERDAKRRERKDRERQERIERRLRENESPTRASSAGRRRREADVDKAADAGIAPALSTDQRPEYSRAQSSIHPALRDEPVLKDADVIGLGVGPSATTTGRDPQHDVNDGTRDPFRDPIAEHRAETEKRLAEGPLHVDTPKDADDNPFEDPVIETAREVRMSTATTPPLSPVDRNRRSSGRIPLEDLTTSALPLASVAASAPTFTTTAHPYEASMPTSSNNRRSGSERRAGAWSSFFKRGSTHRDSKHVESTSFSNTSRDSMNRHSLPPHLVHERASPFQRNASGAPSRTMSKFREDLPDAPISPPDSRMQSPDLPVSPATIAANVAAARSAKAIAGHQHDDMSADGSQEISQARDSAIGSTGTRSDTPVSPIRGHVAMSASMASVDSEGSWLAGGGSGKRASQQSGLTRSLGSLTRHTPDLNASFEDLGSGGDKDAEYVQRTAEARRSSQLERILDATTAGASTGDESVSLDEDAETPGKSITPFTVHESMRRKPNLVHGDPAIRSREGLLSEYAAGESKAASSSVSKDDSPDEYEDQAGARLESARSVDYGSGHARQVSAGSAKLLDVAPRRVSATPSTPASPVSPTHIHQSAIER